MLDYFRNFQKLNPSKISHYTVYAVTNVHGRKGAWHNTAYTLSVASYK